MFARSLPFSPERDAETFEHIPSKPGVFALRASEPGAEPYVSKGSNLKRKLMRLLAPPESQSKRLNLRDRATSIEFSETGSEFENVLLLYRVLRKEFPETYRQRMRLGSMPLVRIGWDNAYPRAYVTTRLGALNKAPVYFGPFRSRAAAEKFLNDALDLFKSRRCTFDLNPDPTFPGCVYSEMKMCLAPCFKGCADREYMTEIGRVQQFLETRGDSLISELAATRDEASADLDFEAAAAIHARVEKATQVIREMEEITGRVDRLDALVVQPSAEKRAVEFFRFCGGWRGPERFQLPIDRAERVSNEAMASGIEKLADSCRASAATIAEELTLLKRWYFRGNRVGEIFLSNEHGEWPLRRIANAAERIAGGTASKDLDEESHRPELQNEN